MAEATDTSPVPASEVTVTEEAKPSQQQAEAPPPPTSAAAASPQAPSVAAKAQAAATAKKAKRWFSMGVSSFASTAKKVAASAEKIANEVFDDPSAGRTKAGHPPWVVFQEEKAILTEQLKIEVLKLSEDHRTFTVPAPSDDSAWQFDKTEAMPFCAAALEEDPRLRNVRFKLVPKHLKEEAFWSNYFYRISLLRERFGVEPLPLVPRAKVVDTDDDLSLEQAGEVDQLKEESSNASPSTSSSTASSAALLASTQRNLKSTGEAAARGVSSLFGSIRSSSMSSSWFGGGTQKAAATSADEATQAGASSSQSSSSSSTSAAPVAKNPASGTNLHSIDERPDSPLSPSSTQHAEDDLAEFVSDDINVDNVDPAERERLRQELEAGSPANDDGADIDLDDLEKYVADVDIDDA